MLSLILSLLKEDPTLIQSVLGIIAGDPALITGLVSFAKAPSWSTALAILEGHPAAVQQVVSAVNTAAQTNPALLTTLVTALAPKAA
jgi:hypothetical protein